MRDLRPTRQRSIWRDTDAVSGSASLPGADLGDLDAPTSGIRTRRGRPGDDDARRRPIAPTPHAEVASVGYGRAETPFRRLRPTGGVCLGNYARKVPYRSRMTTQRGIVVG
jgi:hypothetical protein